MYKTEHVEPVKGSRIVPPLEHEDSVQLDIPGSSSRGVKTSILKVGKKEVWVTGEKEKKKFLLRKILKRKEF